MSVFRCVGLTVDEVVAAIRKLPDKSCAPCRRRSWSLSQTWSLRLYVNCLIVHWQRGYSSRRVQVCIHHTAAKETGHGSVDVRSYRPISNLSVLSKLLERLVHRQMLDYLNRHRLLPRLQSAYRQYYSTETALLRVLADILHAVDTGDLSILALLDLSAAFDTVDHDILLQRLQTSFGVVSVSCD